MSPELHVNRPIEFRVSNVSGGCRLSRENGAIQPPAITLLLRVPITNPKPNFAVHFTTHVASFLLKQNCLQLGCFMASKYTDNDLLYWRQLNRKERPKTTPEICNGDVPVPGTQRSERDLPCPKLGG